MYRLKDRTVVVTGASSGIGRATALAFAREGARLVLAARRPEPLWQTAEDCRDLGVEVLALPTDVTAPEEVEQLARVAVETFDSLDVWVNNAGTGLFGRFWNAPIEAHRRVVEIDLMGAMHGAHAALPWFLEQERGVLINMVSLGAYVATPYADAYTAAKFGLHGLTLSLRQAVRHWPHVHVCGIYPTVIDTPGFSHGANYSGHRLAPPWGLRTPEEVADAVVAVARRPRAMRTIGLQARLAHLGGVVAPDLTARAMAMFFDSYLERAEPVKVTDGNLFEPPLVRSRSRGNWIRRREPARRKMKAAGAGILGLGLAGLGLAALLRGRPGAAVRRRV